jgi:crotonobetainyl-CoA:carnitine CoA-transferase CaiB-like acyl-CoA transferase
VAQRWGNWDPLLSVHGILKCGKSSYPNSKNPQEQEVGFCFVSAFKDEDFKKLCGVVGNAELAKKYPTHADRVGSDAQVAIYPALEKFAADKTKEEVWKAFTGAGLVSQPVWNSNEAANQEHWHLRGSMLWLDDPTFGDVQTQGVAYRLSESRTSSSRSARTTSSSSPSCAATAAPRSPIWKRKRSSNKKRR